MTIKESVVRVGLATTNRGSVLDMRNEITDKCSRFSSSLGWSLLTPGNAFNRHLTEKRVNIMASKVYDACSWKVSFFNMLSSQGSWLKRSRPRVLYSLVLYFCASDSQLVAKADLSFDCRPWNLIIDELMNSGVFIERVHSRMNSTAKSAHETE